MCAASVHAGLRPPLCWLLRQCLYDSRKRFSSAWVAGRAIQRTWPGLLAVFALFGSPHSYAFQSSALGHDGPGGPTACVC